jgi:hypothetical protein
LALPKFLQYVKTGAKKAAGVAVDPSETEAAVDPSESTAEAATPAGYRSLVPAMATAYATDQTARPVTVPAAEPVVTAPVQAYDEAVPQPDGPTVSRADANAAIRDARLRPESKLFNSGDRAADLEDRRDALDSYEPERQHGWQRYLRPIVSGFLGGMRTGDPLGGAGGALFGVARGAVDPKAADRDWKRSETAETDRGLAREYAQEDAAAKRQRLASQSAKDYSEAQAAAMKPMQDALKAEQDNVLGTWKDLDSFDPDAKDAQTVELMARARRSRVTLPRKARGEAFSTAVAPDGSIIVTNTHTGDYKVDRSANVAKPREIKPEDLPDTLFNLPDEKTIADEARAAVAPDLKSRRVTDYAARHYANAEGQFDEGRAWEDIEAGIVKPSEVWENVTSQDDQRLAGARNKIRQRYQGERGLVDDFRLRVSRNKPKDGAAAAPVAQVVTRFNEIRGMKPGAAREKALKDFYDTLPYLNIQ